MSEHPSRTDQPSRRDTEARSAEPDDVLFEDESASILGDVTDEEAKSGENLFGDDMERDYRPVPEPDVYEAGGFASVDEDSEELSPNTRDEAEREMRQRDREKALATGELRRGLIAASAEQVLAYSPPEAPQNVLEIFDEAAREVALARFPRYDRISNRVQVRINDLPLIEDLRSLRHLHLNHPIRTSGVDTLFRCAASA
ncbi:DNA helicase [Fasciola gigantica]|uniref:DNA helicase n=1 Tax=Fasciola gigantica TaxID=46835 RepID=A0A504Z1B3_FASGI|nr:DNA helicase [Fasciola gigantica]